MLQHIIRHSFAEREASSWLPTETAQTRNRSQQLSPEKTECPLPSIESAAQPGDWQWRYAELHILGCLPMARYRRYAFPGTRRWQDMREMRSRATGSGKIPPRCVPGRQSVAGFALHASRKRPRAGKSPVRGKIRAPCIRKRAGFGKICAPCIRNAPQIAVGGYTTRRSCQEGPLFAARAPRITHGAQILPSFGAREERIRPKMPTFCQKLSPKDEKMSPKVLTSF